MNEIIIYNGVFEEEKLLPVFLSIIDRAVEKYGQLIFGVYARGIKQKVKLIKSRMKRKSYFNSCTAINDIFTLRKILTEYCPTGYIFAEDCDWSTEDVDMDVKYCYRKV